VVHGHSIANTVLSRRAGESIRLEGYELLKAFPGLQTHEAAIELPVLDNDQDIARLQAAVEARWARMAPPVLPGYLIRGHGVYVWGPDMDAALARLEGLEFMLACEMANLSLN
jgi:methylthioribulose-1-phosphate dehydratase